MMLYIMERRLLNIANSSYLKCLDVIDECESCNSLHTRNMSSWDILNDEITDSNYGQHWSDLKETKGQVNS